MAINTNDVEFMESVTLVMMETSNSFNDVMSMPYVCFLSIIKNIRMKDLMEIPEWRKKYVEEKYKVARNDDRIDKSQLKIKCDINRLHMFASGL